MSPALALRIIERLEELGILVPGESIILDPMAGISTTGLAAAIKGYPSVMIELEEKFCKLSQANKERMETKLGRPIDMEIIQGDSRHLSQILEQRGLCGIMSPPYGLGKGVGHGSSKLTKDMTIYVEYSDNSSNIGNLPDRPLIGITSPPYANHRNTSQEYDDKYDLRRPSGVTWGRESFRERYSDNPQNIGHLKDVPLIGITSPPYENIEPFQDKEFFKRGYHGTKSRPPSFGPNKAGDYSYGYSEGQLAKEQGESYLEAMLRIYQEMAKCCSAVTTITKNPTKAGKLRLLHKDTVKLMKLSGFRIVAYHRALLFEDIEQGHMFNGSEVKTKGRLSFFKRLAKRRGSPVAMWEDILIARRETDARKNKLAY